MCVGDCVVCSCDACVVGCVGEKFVGNAVGCDVGW